MRKGENPGEVIANLKDKIEDLNQNVLPKDVKIVAFYDREDLVNLAVKTVTHNLIEGILLVTFIVLIFMADWRTTVIVAVVIPLALLFAFICLRVMGMSANLLSMGAIDFGIIIDGAVVMVEGVFVALDKKAREVGMPAFNVMSKMGLIRNTAKDKAKAVFFQIDYHHCIDSYLLFPEGRRKDVLSFGIHAGLCIVGSFDLYIDIGSGDVFHVTEKECS